MDRDNLTISLPQLLVVEACPPEWRHFDLYLFRDEAVVFYAGQSLCAFDRVWAHLHGGPRGHSTVGRLILCNWPRSARFTIEFWSSHAPRFAAAREAALTPETMLDAAERQLIDEYGPCFNEALNRRPTPLPAEYTPPSAPVKHLRSYRRMMQEARFIARKKGPGEWR